MSVNLSPIGGAGWQFFDNNGNPLASGLIYTYAAGTTTQTATYTTSAGNIAQANPIVLNSAGRVPSGEIWLTSGVTYKFVIEDANNNLIGTYDNIIGSGSSPTPSITILNFTGDGTTVSFALSGGATTVYNIFINGVYQNQSTYAVTAGNIVFSQAPPYSSLIEAQV